MARELGFSPCDLIKNIPSRSERWKAPVEEWVRRLYAKKRGRASAKSASSKTLPSSAAPATGVDSPMPATHRPEPSSPAPPNLYREAEAALEKRFREDEIDVETSEAERRELEWDTPVSEGEIAEENASMLRRQRHFRRAAERVAAELAGLPEVQKVALFGSVARPLKKEVPRFSRLKRRGVAIWHECKDIDLAVWLSPLGDLRQIRKAACRALNDLLRTVPNEGGVAHHQVDIHLFEPRTNRFRGCLCHYGECPRGKPECDVPGCGALPFLQLFEDYRLEPAALAPDRSVVLYERTPADEGAASNGTATEGDPEIPF